jgi:hypothetical protein
MSNPNNEAGPVESPPTQRPRGHSRENQWRKTANIKRKSRAYFRSAGSLANLEAFASGRSPIW